MRDTFFKLWVHVVLQTEAEHALIYPELAPLFYLEIEKRIAEQGCECVAVGGCEDHVHFLFSQNPLLSLHETIRFVQGISERWYQLHDFKSGYHKFKWAGGYCAYSVSESIVVKVIEFINNQEQIHQKMLLTDEIRYLNKLHNVDMSDETIELEMQNWQPKYSFQHIGKEWL